jgi:hypothetical protein
MRLSTFSLLIILLSTSQLFAQSSKLDEYIKALRAEPETFDVYQDTRVRDVLVEYKLQPPQQVIDQIAGCSADPNVLVSRVCRSYLILYTQYGLNLQEVRQSVRGLTEQLDPIFWKDLDSDNHNERYRAVAYFGFIKDQMTVDEHRKLRAMTNDEDGSVWAAAYGAICQLKPFDPVSRQLILRELAKGPESPRSYTIALACSRVSTTDADILKSIGDLLKSDDREHLNRMLSVCYMLGQDARAILPQIRELLVRLPDDDLLVRDFGTFVKKLESGYTFPESKAKLLR